MVYKFFLLELLFVLQVISIRTVIPPRTKECFHTEVTREEASVQTNILESSWFVLEGKDRTIKVEVCSALLPSPLCSVISFIIYLLRFMVRMDSSLLRNATSKKGLTTVSKQIKLFQEFIPYVVNSIYFILLS